MSDMDEIIGRIRRDMNSQLRKRARRAFGDEGEQGHQREGWAATAGAGPGAAGPLDSGEEAQGALPR
ncbi:hypothetical protein [Streptomyces orinoci]|uniref:Uncharacterized protein n=1 Tax=Streptomyces orinoci TaxID=67339 RepID=A0ABV3K619_STRON|nr:hypothetical protein [Streptomyces orinoci]